jgi:hypothetical protein
MTQSTILYINICRKILELVNIYCLFIIVFLHIILRIILLPFYFIIQLFNSYEYIKLDNEITVLVQIIIFNK